VGRIWVPYLRLAPIDPFFGTPPCNYFVKTDDIDFKDELEAEADRFSSNLLIPENDYLKFIAIEDFSDKNVMTFAAMIEIHPGIIVGRLQHDHKIGYYQLNHLKVKYEWNNSEDE